MSQKQNKSKQMFTPKQRWLVSALAALALPVTLFNGVFEIYAGNKAELEFAYMDVMPWIALICLGIAMILLCVLLPLRGKAFDITLSVLLGLSVMGYLQGTFLNVGVNSLAADGVGMQVHPAWEIGNAVLWGGVLTVCILTVLLIRGPEAREWLRLGINFLFILVIGVQVSSFAVNSVVMDVFEPKTSPEGSRYILTEKNLLEVSSKDNILIFVLDAYDADYMNAVTAEDPDFFEPLDGFTCYHDNLSWYTRTFPAAASMITGVKNDFSTDASTYFDDAYGNSPFLRDLNQNNYKINLYIDDYYAYRDARTLCGIADNVEEADDGYEVQNVGQLCLHLLGVSAYRYSPIPLKRVFDLSTESFKGFVQYQGSTSPAYHSNDIELYERIRNEGLTVQDEKNTYMFIHLWGCHTPYRMDEHGNATVAGDVEGATKGCMNLIYDYIDELKRLGVYEDATIVITGDHPGRYKDYENVPHPTLTALFFKPKGASGASLAHSHDPVSQDMLIPSLAVSAELAVTQDYGRTYWDGGMNERSYYFLKNTGPADYNVVEYTVTGDGRVFNNWRVTDERDIGFFYE